MAYKRDRKSWERIKAKQIINKRELTTFTSYNNNNHKYASTWIFEPNSFVIGVENELSRTITNNFRHYVKPIQNISRTVIKVLGGKETSINIQVTVRWRIEDYQFKSHTIIIHNSVYVPQYDIYLLSTQNCNEPSVSCGINKRGTG